MPYIEILDSEIQPNAPITSSLMTRLRDNPLVRSLQVFTSSGTWTKPQGCSQALVIAVGSGGSSGAAGVSGTGSDGADGGNSSFGSHVTANGGKGTPGISFSNGDGGDGGAASGGDINIDGGDGKDGDVSLEAKYSFGGLSFLSNFGNTAKSYGSGGHGVFSGVSQDSSGGGGGGATVIKFIESGLGATESVTIGAVGPAGDGQVGGGNGVDGKLGTTGIVIVWEFYGDD